MGATHRLRRPRLRRVEAESKPEIHVARWSAELFSAEGVLAEDRDGEAFAFAPLQGETFEESFDENLRRELPDSIVVTSVSGETLVRSRAALHILNRLGGLWRACGVVIRLVPAPLSDSIYDLVAAIRHHVFARPKDSCPIIPPGLRGRFLQ